MLPKIHKRLHNVPGRPVISNCGYYTENISSFLDYHLKPLAKKVESYIKDTNHFLKKLKELGSLPKNAILCTIDVVGLYPNIPHKEGLASIRKHLDNRENKEVTTDTLVELADIVLKNNYFQFLDKTFKQKRGTAIGTKFAPPYSILFMADLEKRLLSDIDLKPYIWWRYIDDIFLIWEHGEESLKLFLEKINSIHPTIKFTADWSYSSVNFLDVKVIMKDGEIITDLYVKPTDTHQYLDSSSCHPYHCKKSIPYSQALRLNRICSNNAFFDQRCNELEHWLHERGYSERVVRQEILKARKIRRNELLQKEHNHPEENKLTLNITYYPAFQNTKTILEELQILLAPDKEHQNVFPNIPIVGFRNGKSLKDHLVRASLPILNQTLGSESCGKRNCQVSQFIVNTDTFSPITTDETFKINKGPLHCNSKKVIYLSECKKCKNPYVGKAHTKFRMRLNNYKSAHKSFKTRKRETQKLCHGHYIQDDHEGKDDWQFTLIDECTTNAELRKREVYWQHRLKTFYPNGLNEREESCL